MGGGIIWQAQKGFCSRRQDPHHGGDKLTLGFPLGDGQGHVGAPALSDEAQTRVPPGGQEHRSQVEHRAHGAPRKQHEVASARENVSLRAVRRGAAAWINIYTHTTFRRGGGHSNDLSNLTHFSGSCLLDRSIGWNRVQILT